MSFLKAEWRKLIMINYKVNPDVLQPYLPNGVNLDVYKNTCYVSLVGFMFLNTKILGIKVPYHVNFEEVNLRFYVKRYIGNSYKRGVVFIKEIVPKPALTFVANTVYKEHYQTLPMTHHWEETKENLDICYQWKTQEKWNRIAVITEKKALPIAPNSETEFIAEHYWGYSKVNQQKTTEYEVTHPIWSYYPVKDVLIDVDFEFTYGKAFSFLQHQQPKSVMLLEGSQITVESKIVF